MSESDDDDELIRDYLAECREHLATIETDLLAIERGGADIDEQLVNQVFRAAHSIKGGAGFFDLTTIRELAHKTENVLDMIRSRQMAPTPEVVSILLLSFDKLRALLERPRESNGADIADFTSGLARLAADQLPADQKASVTETVSITKPAGGRIEVSTFDLRQARKSGKNVYLILYNLIHDIQRPGKLPYEVLKRLMEYGTILETAFDLKAAGTLDDEPSTTALLLEVVYATALGADLIFELPEIPRDRTCLIAKDGSVQSLASTGQASVPVVAIPPAQRKAPPADSGQCAVGSVQQLPAAHCPPPTDSTIRLNVTLLDSLMTLAGELVLSRNQLNECVARQDERGIRTGAQRINLVTSELQEVVTLTRMQPVGNVFARFPRVVRDLARDLGKEAQLKIEGAEVELDKTILEGLSDPLTHMVRNSVDHGIEPPLARQERGKPRMGTITLRAAHQAGQVMIEISDDGKGLDAEKVAASALSRGLVTPDQLQAMSEREKMALILCPGVSTASQVSDVSGRGVGMDVVKTNLDRLGGKIEIDSTPGRGASFRIKLPLTLAIIPSLLISHGGERFAIPQVSVSELIRIPAAQLAQRINRVGGAQVLILRDRLVPLLHLSHAFGLARDTSAGQAWNVVLVDAGAFEYGLIVEQLHDTVEIVVKPLGRHLKVIADYAGATILGDGRVAVILDVAGLAARGGLTAASVQAVSRGPANAVETSAEEESYSLLLFRNGPGESCAVPIYHVSRIERVRPNQIEHLGGRRTMQYLGASLPVMALSDVAGVGHLSESQAWVVIIFEHAGRPMGLLGAEPLDMIESRIKVDDVTLRQKGIAGSAILKKNTTLIVDLLDLVKEAQPELAEGSQPRPSTQTRDNPAPAVLLAEDSDFFRRQLRKLIEAVGYRVFAAEDGQQAWELLEAHAGEIGLVTTDIEMPRMDGLALTRRIRADERFRTIPVIAVSTLAGEEEVARGLAAGVTEYQVKLNKDELQKSIQRIVGGHAGCAVPVGALQGKNQERES